MPKMYFSFFTLFILKSYRYRIHKSFQISLFPWLPLSKTTKVPITTDWVVTIVDPIETLEKMYKRDVLKDDQDSSINE